MARRPKTARQSLQEQMLELFRTHKAAAEWSSADIAEHLGCNQRSVKEHPEYRRLLAERYGMHIPEPEMRALKAIAHMGYVKSADVAERLGLSPGLVRRRLRSLRDAGYVRSVTGA